VRHERRTAPAALRARPAGYLEATVPPSPGGPRQQVQRDHDETFVVTERRLRSTCRADGVDVEAGRCVTVLAGSPHALSNPLGEAGKFICRLTPELQATTLNSSLSTSEGCWSPPTWFGRRRSPSPI
jgi:hypothetical protein